jgi:hypothetical protein
VAAPQGNSGSRLPRRVRASTAYRTRTRCPKSPVATGHFGDCGGGSGAGDGIRTHGPLLGKRSTPPNAENALLTRDFAGSRTLRNGEAEGRVRHVLPVWTQRNQFGSLFQDHSARTSQREPTDLQSARARTTQLILFGRRLSSSDLDPQDQLSRSPSARPTCVRRHPARRYHACTWRQFHSFLTSRVRPLSACDQYPLATSHSEPTGVPYRCDRP